jgi:heat shock protein HslJ
MKTTSFYLSLFLCIFSLSACNLFKKSPEQQTGEGNSTTTKLITDRKWKLVELAGQPVADQINGKEPFLMLNLKDNRYSASGGCNGLGGDFELQGELRIKFVPGMSTMMACENMEIEKELNRVFSLADNYSLSGDNLSLNKARMAPLARFKAIK